GERGGRARMFWAGFCAGFAVLAEYPVALGVAAIAALVWWERAGLGRFLAGAAPAAAAFVAHNRAVSGAPWAPPYELVLNMWDGGGCTGPRRLLPVVLLVLYEGAGAWARTRRFGVLFVALAVLGVVVNVAFAATDPIPSTAQPRPFMDIVFPHVRDGNINPHNI